MSTKNFFPAIVFTICATVAILYWQLIYLPVQSEISNLAAESKRLETIEKELEILQARHKNFEEFVASTEEKLFQMQELLPAEMNAEKFIAALYTSAENKKILINSVQTGEISEKDSVQRQEIKINLDADYISLLNFIREVIDGDRLASLENFSIAKDGKSHILNCELEFIIFAANVEN